MSHRGGKNTRSRKWALLGSRDLIDYTSLTILGNLVKEFEGKTVPSVAELENLLDNENRAKCAQAQDDESDVQVDSRSRTRNMRKRRRSSKKNEDGSAMAVTQGEHLPTNSRIDIDSISMFYNAFYSRYHLSFRRLFLTPQRYQSKDIDEATLMSQIKHLLRDAPDLFNDFKTMIHGEEAYNKANTHAEDFRSRGAKEMHDEEDMVKNFLRRVRSCMEFHAYNAFLDAMVELRAMYRLHKGPQAIEKLEQVKLMLGRVDKQLRNDLDLFFPLLTALQSRSKLEKQTLEQSQKHFQQWQKTQLARNLDRPEPYRPSTANDEEIRMHAMAELQKYYNKPNVPPPPKKMEKHAYQPPRPHFPPPPRPNMFMRHPEMASHPPNYYNMNNMYFNKPSPVSTGHWSDGFNTGQHNYVPVSSVPRREDKLSAVPRLPMHASAPMQQELTKIEIPSLQEGLSKNKSLSPQMSSTNGLFLENSRPLLSQNSLPTPFAIAIPPVTSVAPFNAKTSPNLDSAEQPLYK